jgi:hypothetical protein
MVRKWHSYHDIHWQLANVGLRQMSGRQSLGTLMHRMAVFVWLKEAEEEDGD